MEKKPTLEETKEDLANAADERRPSVIAIPVERRNSNFDESWKVVGSPPRKNSFQMSSHTAMAKRPSLVNIKASDIETDKNGSSSQGDHPLSSSFTRRASNAGQWVSMGGFQWEGPSIFDDYNDERSRSIKAVPMVPDVSTEPIYREQRSFSFSVGQDPSFFGYDDYDEIESTLSSVAYQNQLATMEEEDETEFDVMLKDRLRSQSSSAALGLLSAQHHAHLMRGGERRGSEQLDEVIARRRTSTYANDATAKLGSSFGSQRSSFLPPSSSLSQSFGYQDYTAIEHQVQRRLSQSEQIPGLQHMHPMQQMQYLSEQLDATRLNGQQQLPFMNHSYPNPMMSMMPDPNQMGMPLAHPGFPMSPYMMDQQHDYYNQAAPKEQDRALSYKQVADQAQLFLVEFKTARSEVFFVADPEQIQIRSGDLVIVEADRGKDLGKVISEPLTVEKATELVKKHVQQQQQQQQHHNENILPPTDPSQSPSEQPVQAEIEAETEIKPLEFNPKRIYRLALPGEVAMLIQKSDDEQKALTLCQIKVKQKKLPMEVVDAEYQWDRRKLTFYFNSDRRIDFRELVRELFKIYKTRIWMCAVYHDSQQSS
ncbi:PSP1 C-terminal conserved region-domain-containing protein [Umbelopsis sp. PMI_123]|nr:PSP1 C-terminal conserved region-domain-containing protein [Umbelopsis sp. PMI_123]